MKARTVERAAGGSADFEQLPRDVFAIRMAMAFALVVLVGFGPTFFVRPFFDVPPVPGYVLLHGAVMTSWFALLLVQAVLVATDRVSTHRRVGIAGLAVGAAVVVVGSIATLGLVPRHVALGRTIDDGLVITVWVDLSGLLAFAVFLLAAMAWRRQREVHRRLMLFASLSLIGPALARMAAWPILGPLARATPLVGLVLLLGAMVYHDLRVRRSLHAVTIAGSLFFVLSLVAAFAVGRSSFGRLIVRSMG